MGEAKNIATRLSELHGEIRQEQDHKRLLVIYPTRQHTRKKHIDLSDHAYNDALEWLEATYKRLYNAVKEEELENEEVLSNRLTQEE
jgi:hypothetical protein